MFRRAASPSERVESANHFLPHRARLERTFKDHHLSVWRMLRRRGFTPEVAADLTQQAFVIVAERLDEIVLGSERAFLMATVLRLAMSAARRERRIDLADDMDVHPSRGRDLADTRSAINLLDSILARIDPTLVEVFVLFELEEMSSPEIARLLEIPVGTIASRLRRAREAFRVVADRVERTLRRESQERGGIRSV
jgi:RNA polymerase sigma-70 factor (ECF subfamily)